MVVRTVAATVALTASCLASISITIDKLDATDGVSVPAANFMAIDIYVSLSPFDAFSGLGIVGTAESGAEIAYERDPNGVVATAPGIDNRFVTFFSRPRNRDEPGRFDATGAVSGFMPYFGGSAPSFDPFFINAASGIIQPLREPGRSGWVHRLVLDLSNVADPLFQVDSENIVVSNAPIPNAVELFRAYPGNGVIAASNLGSISTSFGVYGIPEPATAVLFLPALWLIRARGRFSR